MTSKEFLKIELEKINDIFTSAIFCYEFINQEKTHMIDVRPLCFFDSDEFLDARFDLREKMSISFPNESILFVSELSKNKIICPEFVISKYLLKTNILITTSLYNFSDLEENYIISAGENTYALAA